MKISLLSLGKKVFFWKKYIFIKQGKKKFSLRMLFNSKRKERDSVILEQQRVLKLNEYFAKVILPSSLV